ncbi:MAG TPA: alpha/beta hydrolase [Pseudonocardiaceae bacterium]
MDRSAFALAVGCEPPVAHWFAVVDQLAAELPDLHATDWTRRRRAARELSDLMAMRFTQLAPIDCELTEYQVPTRAGEVTVLRYHPVGGERPRPAHLSLHGGGFVIGSVREIINERLLRRRAVDSGVDIFAAEYRLAPEHPFPAALDDCVDVLTWLASSADELGIDRDRIGIGGASAGGNLAALVAVHARDHGGPHLDHQLLEVPAASLNIADDESFRAYGALEADIAEACAIYLAGNAPGWSAPNDVPDLADLPPALVITAECDPLRDSGETYAARLAAAGVPVRAWRAPAQAHGSAAITRSSATAREWQDRASGFLRARVRETHNVLTRPR